MFPRSATVGRWYVSTEIELGAVEDSTEPEAPATQPPSPSTPTDFDATADAMFARFNRERAALGLPAFGRAVSGDASLVQIRRFPWGCNDPLNEDMQSTDIDALGFEVWTHASECAVEIVLYHVVPVGERLRVSQSDWDCFIQSQDFRNPDPVSCAGRYSFAEGHIRWMPERVTYRIVEGGGLSSRFAAMVPWVKAKTGIDMVEAGAGEPADLSIWLGGGLPAGCRHAAGCNILTEQGDGWYSAQIYVTDQGEYTEQVMKHELLHALLPMGHMPGGDYLMSASSTNPELTQNLTPLEERLLKLYTHPYLREGMRMDDFKRYLIIE